MSTASSSELKNIVSEARPAYERHLNATKNSNRFFMAAWRSCGIDRVWSAVRDEYPSLRLHYFIRARGLGDIKIGKTKQIDARFKQLFTRCSRGADLVACYPAGPEHETELFADFGRSRLCGEWFRASPDLIDYLRLIGTNLDGFPDEPAQRWVSRVVAVLPR